jgi:hypothetical protein
VVILPQPLGVGITGVYHQPWLPHCLDELPFVFLKVLQNFLKIALTLWI